MNPVHRGNGSNFLGRQWPVRLNKLARRGQLARQQYDSPPGPRPSFGLFGIACSDSSFWPAWF
jgi:hypothetical protein